MSATVQESVTTSAPSRFASGLGLALVSAFAFGLSGALASQLLDHGWTPGAVVLARIGIATLAVLPLGLRAIGGRWHLLRRNLRLVVGYGIMAVAGAQFCYFSAISQMDVGPALLIEYTAPAAVVAWLWVKHGHSPGRTTLAGAALAAVGLILVLDVLSGSAISPSGTAWALAAMVGAATYFVLSADDRTGLPAITLAAGGLLVGGLALGALALVGLMPMAVSSSDVVYAGVTVSWWVPILTLGLVTAALAYATGIAAARLLAPRLASFIALVEVLAGALFAWLLLSELPGRLQLVGGGLVLIGVVVVKLGEPQSAAGDG